MDIIVVVSNLSEGWYMFWVVKEIEVNIGWLVFGGVMVEKLVKFLKCLKWKIEFIGDFIICGVSFDDSEIFCGSGVWED